MMTMVDCVWDDRDDVVVVQILGREEAGSTYAAAMMFACLWHAHILKPGTGCARRHLGLTGPAL